MYKRQHRANGRDGWSSRVIWRGDKAAQYVYAADQAGDYGDIAVWPDGHNRLTTGVWHRVQTYVHLNTPGKADGVIISWLDGHEAYTELAVRALHAAYGLDKIGA